MLQRLLCTVKQNMVEYMNKIIEQYIKNNKVSESNALIFRNWKDFLHILFQNNGQVEMIVWYEYCRINNQQIGMGGYIDSENQGFMWAETQLFKTDMQEKSLDEILDYISATKQEYSEYDLYPEFYIN